MARATTSAPGSDSPGVPASVTSATLRPCLSHWTTFAAMLASLCWCSATGRLPIPCRLSRDAVLRVSSAAMTSAAASTFSARSVMSSTFPMGVATTYNVPSSPWRPSPCTRSIAKPLCSSPWSQLRHCARRPTFRQAPQARRLRPSPPYPCRRHPSLSSHCCCRWTPRISPRRPKRCWRAARRRLRSWRARRRWRSCAPAPPAVISWRDTRLQQYAALASSSGR